MTKDFNEIQAVSGDMIATINNGHAIVRTNNEHVTAIAVQRPRSLIEVKSKLIQEASMAGSDFYYCWTINSRYGKREIKGASIGLAYRFCWNFMNCFYDVRLFDETPTHYIIEAIFVDVENGVTMKRLFQQRKAMNIGKKFDDDYDRKLDIAFQIGQSKAIRNVILAMAPSWIISDVIEAAMKAEKSSVNKVENLKEAIENIKIFFEQKHGVTVEMLEFERGKKIDDLTQDDIVALRGTATAIKNGYTSANSLFIEPYNIIEPYNKLKNGQKKQENEENSSNFDDIFNGKENE